MEKSRKKLEKEPLTEESNSSKAIPIQAQADEMFFQAYEKPVLIYRYYRGRSILKPSHLQRTLSYMKDRSKRNNQRRKNFQVDSLLQIRLNQDRMQKANIYGNFLHIVYLGLFNEYNNKQDLSNDVIKIEVTLSKVPRSIHRDKKIPADKIQTLLTEVFTNNVPNGKFPVINIPLSTFKVFGETLNYSYKISFSVEVMSKSKIMDSEEESAAKRPRPNSKLFRSELDIWEDDNTFIGSAEYETKLKEVNSSAINHYISNDMATWESDLPSGDTFPSVFNAEDDTPVLRFHLSWSNEVSAEVIDTDRLTEMAKPSSFNFTNVTPNQTDDNLLQLTNNNNVTDKAKPNANGKEKDKDKSKKPFQIIYNFMYNNNTRQQTEYSKAMVCPWCELNCVKLYSLLNHLKLNHNRLNFAYQPIANGARIDVTINDAYDGAYAGSPFYLAGPTECAIPSEDGPSRRTTMTDVMVCRPRRQKAGLSEFLEVDEDELSNQRTYVTGHNRLYYHTETCLPVQPKELDIDSEGENDPAWLRHKTMQMIDEFSDVNEGEKEVMKMWNLHVLKNGYVGDCQLPIACEMFVDHHGEEIIRKNLYRNFILHMCSLFDYGLIAPEVVYKTIQRLQNVLSTNPEGQKVISESRETQLKYWLDVGILKQELEEVRREKPEPIAQQNGKSPTKRPTKTPESSKKPSPAASLPTNGGTKKTPSVAAKENSSESAKKGNANSSKPKPINNNKAKINKTNSAESNNTGGGKLSAPNKRSASPSTSSANEKPSMKRRLSILRGESPTRSRSASLNDVPRRLITRRQSVAIVNGHNLLSASSSTSLRNRFPKN